MKILKYILFLALALAVIFVAIGLLIPSIAYESEVSVDKPAHEAWSVMNDESKMSQWLPGFVKSEHVSGTPNTVGAVSKVYFNEDGQETVIQETVTAIVPNKKLGMKFSIEGFMDMDYELSVIEKGGKATMTSTTTTVGNGILGKSMVALMKGAMKTQEDTNMASLQKLINDNTTKYQPAGITNIVPINLNKN